MWDGRVGRRGASWSRPPAQHPPCPAIILVVLGVRNLRLERGRRRVGGLDSASAARRFVAVQLRPEAQGEGHVERVQRRRDLVHARRDRAARVRPLPALDDLRPVLPGCGYRDSIIVALDTQHRQLHQTGRAARASARHLEAAQLFGVEPRDDLCEKSTSELGYLRHIALAFVSFHAIEPTLSW